MTLFVIFAGSFFNFSQISESVQTAEAMEVARVN